MFADRIRICYMDLDSHDQSTKAYHRTSMSIICQSVAYYWTSKSIVGGHIAYNWTSRSICGGKSILNCRSSLRVAAGLQRQRDTGSGVTTTLASAGIRSPYCPGSKKPMRGLPHFCCCQCSVIHVGVVILIHGSFWS